jgi:hypothetical protein
LPFISSLSPWTAASTTPSQIAWYVKLQDLAIFSYRKLTVALSTREVVTGVLLRAGTIILETESER